MISENSSPFFSVIIPTFNREKMLPETIGSVLGQTFKNFEIIVVDDGSTDNTKAVVTSISDSRIKYIYQKNSERSAARNNGIQCSGGEYICFLDSDDIFLKDHLSTLFSAIEQSHNEIGLFFTNCNILNDENQVKERPCPSLGNKNPKIYFLKQAVIPARVCIHNKILSLVNFREDVKIVEDAILWISIAQAFPVHHIEKDTVLYRVHEENSVNEKFNGAVYRLNGLKKLFADSKNSKGISKKQQHISLSLCYYSIARYHEYHKHLIPMIQNLLISFYYHPFSPYNKNKAYLIYKNILPKSMGFHS